MIFFGGLSWLESRIIRFKAVCSPGKRSQPQGRLFKVLSVLEIGCPFDVVLSVKKRTLFRGAEVLKCTIKQSEWPDLRLCVMLWSGGA